MNRVLPFFVLVLLGVSCSASKPSVSQNLLSLQTMPPFVDSVLKLKGSAKLKKAKAGMAAMDDCLLQDNQAAGCYYYRALLRGLYLESVGVGHQKGLKKMVADCQAVIRLDPRYEAGGAYRLLAYIYLKAPVFALASGAVTRDVEKATRLAQKALGYGKDHPDNQVLWDEVLLAQDK